METIRVLVADDDSGVVDVLRALIQNEPDLQFVGSANDAEGAIALAVKERPDVALVDVRMPGGGGIRAAREITRRCPPTKVIALTAHEDNETVIAIMGAGAHAYVPKGESTERILREIHRPAGEGHARADTGVGVWGGARETGPRRPGSRRSEQQSRIRDVLNGDALSAAFQPIFEAETGAVAGVEAVTRVARLPVRGLDAWLAEAEAVGLLLDFELAATRVALGNLPLVPGSAFLALKASPSTVLDPMFRETLLDGPTERIVVELTEHAPIDDYGTLNDVLATLRSEGVRLAVADAGAGVASLGRVVMLAPDLLKIDRLLTDTVDRDETRHAVVAAVTACAAQLGARTIAEDVTSKSQLDELTRLGVDLVQGSLLAELGRRAGRDHQEAFSSETFRADALGQNEPGEADLLRRWES